MSPEQEIIDAIINHGVGILPKEESDEVITTIYIKDVGFIDYLVVSTTGKIRVDHILEGVRQVIKRVQTEYPLTSLPNQTHLE